MIKHQATGNLLLSLYTLYQKWSCTCSLHSELRDMVNNREVGTWPPLKKTHSLKLQYWAKKYLKTDFSKLPLTDETRVTLDGPEGWGCSWITTGHRAPLAIRCQQSGNGVLAWIAVIKDDLFLLKMDLELSSNPAATFWRYFPQAMETPCNIPESYNVYAGQHSITCIQPLPIHCR